MHRRGGKQRGVCFSPRLIYGGFCFVGAHSKSFVARPTPASRTQSCGARNLAAHIQLWLPSRKLEPPISPNWRHLSQIIFLGLSLRPCSGRVRPGMLLFRPWRCHVGRCDCRPPPLEKNIVRPKSLRLVREPSWQDGPGKVMKTIGLSYFLEDNLRLA